MSGFKHVGRWFVGLLRRDWGAYLLYLMTTILMTYPIAFKLGTNWLAFRDSDTYVKLWDNWWLTQRQLGDPAYYTNDLFYPNGLDLAYHSISWTAAWLARIFATAVDPITAYNLTILVAVFATAYGAYLLIYQLVNDRRAAWLGGAIYTFAPYHISHTGGHPDLTHLAPIPLAALFLIDAFENKRWWTAVLAAFMIMVSAYTSLYIMNFAILTIGPLFLFLLFKEKRWKDKKIWSVTAVFGLFTILFLMPRLIPIFQNPAGLSQAIEQKYVADAGQTDLLAFITPSHFNPLFQNRVSDTAHRFAMNLKWPAYLGIVPLLLTLFAATWRKHFQNVLPWLAIGFLFFVLTLGPVLRFNGQLFESTPLPAFYLSWFPPIRAVGRPDFFVLGLLLPLAVTAAFGFKRLLEWLQNHSSRQRVAVVCLSTLLLFEYWNGFYPGIDATISDFYRQLGQTAGESALVELPMGRSPSKFYVYYQTVHQKPLVEGLSARTPAQSYSYIRNNELLTHWFNQQPLDCQQISAQEIQGAIRQLQADNFEYILIHVDSDGHFPRVFTTYFPIEPVFQDEDLIVFHIAALEASSLCA